MRIQVILNEPPFSSGMFIAEANIKEKSKQEEFKREVLKVCLEKGWNDRIEFREVKDD